MVHQQYPCLCTSHTLAVLFMQTSHLHPSPGCPPHFCIEAVSYLSSLKWLVENAFHLDHRTFSKAGIAEYQEKVDNQTCYFIAAKWFSVLPPLKSVPRNSREPKPSLPPSAPPPATLFREPIVPTHSQLGRIIVCICRTETEFPKYLVTLLKLALCLGGQSISRWNKCSIKLHYFGGRLLIMIQLIKLVLSVQ